MKCDAPKEGCNESLHPAICVKLPVAGLRRQMRKELPAWKLLAICMDDDSSTLGIMKELNNKKEKWSVTHKGGWPLSILYIRLQGIKQFF